MKRQLLLLTILLISLSANAYDAYIDGIYYNLNKDAKTAEVTSGDNKYEGEVVIPETITNEGVSYSVTLIGDYAFRYCSGLTSVTIPNSVTSIGDNAFRGCSGLTSVSIPNSVTAIEGFAFAECSGLTSINIPNSVTSIGDGAFEDCSGLTSINIPNSVTSIGRNTFFGCSSLSSITIPNGVISIGIGAFSGCSGLTSVTLPNSVTAIGESAFSGCSSLTSITIPIGVTAIGESAFRGCRGLDSITIPNSVTSIGIGAFYGCIGLTSVSIPNSVNSIGDVAFYGCSGLTSVTIPNSVTSIGSDAFSGCSGLTSINIPNSVTSIGRKTFYGCSSLTSITIPNSVISIGDYAFSVCSGLTSIVIPNSVISIGYRAFEYCSGLTTVTIPNSVTSIGDNAFSDCSGLTSVTIPNSVTSIAYGAFDGCSGLTSVTIPNSVVSIGDYAFQECSGLTSVTIPNSVTSIGGCAFYECSSLQDLYCLAENIPETGYGCFYNAYQATLHVPFGCKEKYAAVEPWKNFKEIVEMGDPNLFPDCPAGEVRDAALYLYRLGIVEGEDGLLKPNRTATRAEVAKTSLYGAYWGPDNVPTDLVTDKYPSVYYDLQDDTTYYYRPAKALLYLEYGDGVAPFDRNRLAFEPKDSIARVHVLKALMETFNIQPDLEGSGNPFPNDANVVKIATEQPRMMGYIRKAADLGIITKDNAEFRPYAYCTRGEAFLMLARIMKKADAGEITKKSPQDADYFQPLNTTLKTIAMGAGLTMGNFQHYTKTSFAIGGVMPLVFGHTYNSYNTTLPDIFFGDKNSDEEDNTYQPLGDGWSHTYHVFATVVGDLAKKEARLIVHWGNGGVDVYQSDGSKLIPESMGIYDDCALDGKELVITTKSQMKYRFAAQSGSNAKIMYLKSITDRNDNALTISYVSGTNDSYRIDKVSDGNRSLQFSYLSGTDLVSEVRDPLNRTISFAYFDNKQTGRKQLQSFTDAEGNKTTYEYADLTKAGTSKLLSKIQLPKGNYIENEYDANRRLKKTVSGISGVPTTQMNVSVNADYNNSNVSTSSKVDVLRNGQMATYNYIYNENNALTQMTGQEGLYLNSSYGNSDHPELPTAISNNSTTVSDVQYDSKGNMTSITVSGDGTLTTTMTYNSRNDIESITDPNGNVTRYSYDSKGNLTEVSAPEGVTAKITVGSKGLPQSVRNAMDVVTNFEYNSYGNLTKTTLPALGLSSSAAYDSASRLTSVTNAKNQTTKFEYDKNDLLKQETDAMNHTTRYDYDANSNLERITNAKGGVTTLTYDNATDWLTAVSFGGATKQYSYNEDGTLNSFTKPDGTVLNCSYDALGRMTSDGVNSYSYDNNMRLSSVSGNGKSISFGYDGFGRITSTNGDGHNNSYQYDKNGNCIRMDCSDYSTMYEYDGLNRLTLVAVGTGNGSIEYSYRKDSQLSYVTYPNGMRTDYSYDAVGRLTGKKTTLSNGSVVAEYSFTLDKLGNIIEQTAKEPYEKMMLANEETSYTYNNANRITNAGDISFSFDENGNATKRGGEEYAWDKQDRLTNAAGTAITYDPLGLIASYGDITFTTDPLGMGNVLSDSKSGAQYVYGNGLEARILNGKFSYYVTDCRGSVVAIVDQDGNITHKYQYDEFGKVTQKEEADYNPFQYVGKYGVMCLNDHLYYMRARHYDPTIGRFLSEDPIWSTNLYPYADNNPIMGIDPKGLYTQKEIDEVRNGAYKGCRYYNSGNAQNLKNCYNFIDNEIANVYGTPTDNFQEQDEEWDIIPKVENKVENNESAIDLVKESIIIIPNQNTQNNSNNSGKPDFSLKGAIKNILNIPESAKDGGEYFKDRYNESGMKNSKKYTIWGQPK